MSIQSKLTHRYIAPLFDFPFPDSHFDIDSSFRVKRIVPPLDCNRWAGFLSADDLARISKCAHVLILDVRPGEYPRPKELFSLFLFSLWLARPTRTSLHFRFVADDANIPVFPQAVRILDIHQWLKGDVYDTLSLTHLKRAASFFESLKNLSRDCGRIYTALTYGHYACTTVRWQVAFTMYAASLETLFFPDSRKRITHKLATRIACFLENSGARRKRLYHRVCDFYDIRSAILHGRFIASLEDESNSAKNLRDLAVLTVTLRRAWRKILSDKELMLVFNSDTTKRNSYFDRLSSGSSLN